MKSHLLIFTIFFLFTFSTKAQTTHTSSSRTNIYEQQAAKDESKIFTAKVRIVRDISDDLEVFFEGEVAKGAYTLPRQTKGYAAILKTLEASKKADGQSVTVTADKEKNISSVEASKAKPGFIPPSDPNQKWDFGKMPD
jgi:hypothetical protein